MGHTGQILGWESFAAYNVMTGDVVVLMVNETGSLPAALSRLLPVAKPDLSRAIAG